MEAEVGISQPPARELLGPPARRDEEALSPGASGGNTALLTVYLYFYFYFYFFIFENIQALLSEQNSVILNFINHNHHVTPWILRPYSSSS